LSEATTNQENAMPTAENGNILMPIRAPDTETALAVMELGRGHGTSDRWLPDQDYWPELTEARETHLRVRGQLLEELDALDALDARFAEEDRDHGLELRQAQREGRRPGKDARTSPEERAAERSKVAERAWAALLVLKETVDSTVALIREHEEEWLAALRAEREGMLDKVREAEKVLAEAKVAEYGLWQRRQYLMMTADHSVFGLQPFPEPQEPPRGWTPTPTGLERRWFEDNEQMVSHQESSGVTNEDFERRRQELAAELEEGEGDEASVPRGDVTGIVSELDEGQIGASR
jgi:hypothetical protein